MIVNNWYLIRRDCYKEIKYMLEQVYQNLSNGNNAMQNSNVETNHCGFIIQDNEKNVNSQVKFNLYMLFFF